MIKPLLLVNAILLTYLMPAQAEENGSSFVVTAQSLYPESEPKSVPCNSVQRQCFISLVYQKGNAPIDIAISFKAGEARLQFMQGRRYLPIRNDGETLLIVPLENGTAQTDIDLFDPESLEPDRLIQKPVIKTGHRLAQLRVNIDEKNQKTGHIPPRS